MERFTDKSKNTSKFSLFFYIIGKQFSYFKCVISVFQFYVCLFSLLTVFSACDQTFEPLEENNEFVFSMYGAINASADTKWVHITPIRKQVDMLAEVPEMRVTLINAESGREIVMNDSLFQRGANFLNFWTDETIEYDQTYRLIAELENGDKSEVTVIIPEELPPPKIAIEATPSPFQPVEYYLLVDKSVNLADIQAKYYVRLLAPNLNVVRTFSFSYRNLAKVTEDYPDYFSVQLKPEDDVREIEEQVLLPRGGKIQIVYRQIFVAASGTEWNEEIESLDDVTYALPQTFRNVENGLGYVMGIDGKYIPFQGCNDFEGNVISCGDEPPFR